MTDMNIPHDVSSHGPYPTRITQRSSRPSPVARHTDMRLEPLLREWLRLRTIVDTLLQRASTAPDGTTRAARHPTATNWEPLDD
jgi:hypothetical protein